MKLSRLEKRRQRQEVRETRRTMLAAAMKSRRKTPRHRNSIPLALAHIAALSQKPNHQRFTREWNDERDHGRSRLYRNIGEDWRMDVASRFGAISMRASYQRRRGR